MKQNTYKPQTEISASPIQPPNFCPDTVQQVGDGAVAVTVILSITMLIRSITTLIKAKAE